MCFRPNVACGGMSLGSSKSLMHLRPMARAFSSSGNASPASKRGKHIQFAVFASSRSQHGIESLVVWLVAYHTRRTTLVTYLLTYLKPSQVILLEQMRSQKNKFLFYISQETGNNPIVIPYICSNFIDQSCKIQTHCNCNFKEETLGLHFCEEHIHRQ